MNARDIKVALADRADDFARWLFPAGRKHGREWKLGSLAGEPGESLSICLAGAKAGVFSDSAEPKVGFRRPVRSAPRGRKKGPGVS